MSMPLLEKGRRVTWVVLVLAGVTLLALATSALNQPVAAAPASAVQPQTQAPTDETCLACHSQEANQVTLESGETLSLYVNPDAFGQSVHGQNEVACASCHADITSFPHPEKTAKTLRDVALQYSQTCEQCHSEKSTETKGSVHGLAHAAGNTNAATCSDCHNPHEQKPVAELTKVDIANTCAQCHNAIFETYKTSIHGSALIGEGNTDVATCTDCHGVHDIQSASSVEFRNFTPQLCSKCHTDPAVMDKYGLSTEVLNTYVADFHGTTVTLFQSTSPDHPTNKAVCTDCHGVHDIRKVDDPQYGIAMKENLLVKCQNCHPSINQNFSDAWMGHYIPSPEKYPIVYFVNLFYQFFIPAVLGGMAVFVITDAIRRLIERSKKGAAH